MGVKSQDTLVYRVGSAVSTDWSVFGSVDVVTKWDHGATQFKDVSYSGVREKERERDKKNGIRERKRNEDTNH